jgi:hypothetical protein
VNHHLIVVAMLMAAPEALFIWAVTWVSIGLILLLASSIAHLPLVAFGALSVVVATNTDFWDF